MSIWMQELLGVVVAWLEMMFVVNVITLSYASELTGMWDMSEWIGLASGPSQSLADLSMPTGLVERYQATAELLANLMPGAE